MKYFTAIRIPTAMSDDNQLHRIHSEYFHSEFIKINSVEINHYGDTWRTRYGVIRIKH